VFERRKVAVVNKQHHVSKGLEMGFLQSGKINDIFKNLRVFTTVDGKSGVEVEVLSAESNEILSVQKRRLHNE
jgi:hypothetical protein